MSYKIEKIRFSLTNADGVGLTHDSRKDVRRLASVVNRLIDKINELIEENNNLQEDLKTLKQQTHE